MKELFIIRSVHRSFKILVGIVTIIALALSTALVTNAHATSHPSKAKTSQVKKKTTQKHHHKKKMHKKNRQSALPAASTSTSSATTNQTTSKQDQVDTTTTSNSTGTIIGNSRTMVYHTPDQSNYHINSGNIIAFRSEAEAQAAGYHKAAR
ncbi:hypothetical protein [Fructilactobacillus cliffordii]|uniref:Uncharacterized protein n=1 Tax=Fructilactobacillus cliffordii TaxID=2940299 RepID=A0A9Q8ZTT7_9LACO|nr:hypothetical protein [Fructilactobacillus cliffordii]USS89208.1 hypothetical protein M3M40_06985 [Fructilactobacillus cliffordii]